MHEPHANIEELIYTSDLLPEFSLCCKQIAQLTETFQPRANKIVAKQLIQRPQLRITSRKINYKCTAEATRLMILIFCIHKVRLLLEP